MNKYLKTLTYICNKRVVNKSFPTQLIFKAMSSDNKDTIFQASDSWFAKYNHAPDAPDGVFRGVIDRFNGITVDSNMETCEEGNFEIKLKDSLQHWIEANRRGIWFKVHLKDASWVPILAKV